MNIQTMVFWMNKINKKLNFNYNPDQKDILKNYTHNLYN